MQYAFGSGNLYGLVTSGAILVPRKFGTLQDVSLDFSFNLKKLYGQYQFPVAIARGQGSIQGKADAANLNGAALNDIFFAGTNVTGSKSAAIGEAGAIPASPFQITVANSAQFVDDLGVTFVATGVPLTRVASAPAVGQYSVAAGVYTFNAGDTGKAVVLDYSYTVAASGNTTTVSNQLSGASTPQFVAVLNVNFQGKQLHLRLNACFSSKLSIATKIEDFIVPAFDFEACADAANVIGTLSLAE